MTKARSNAVANAAKGDLTVGSGTNLSGVLGVGSNGDTIVADSSTATGLRYTAGTVQSNPVLNSAFQLWQRGTSLAVTAGGVGKYIADRWQVRADNTAALTFSRQTTNDTTNLSNVQYCIRAARNSGSAIASYVILEQSFESINSIPYVGKIVTFSFYARKGADFSGASSQIVVGLKNGTGTDQNIGSVYTGEASVIASTATLTTTWQRFTYTGTVPTTATELGIQIFYQASGTAGAADYYEITGVQVDIGSVALPFRTNGATIQGELAACQRYFWKQDVTITPIYANGACADATNHYGFGSLPITMRTAPTATATAASTFYVTASGVANVVATGITISLIKTNGYRVYASTASNAAFAQGRSVIIENNSGSYIDWSAEL